MLRQCVRALWLPVKSLVRRPWADRGRRSPFAAFQSFRQDLRYAVRTLARTPVFSAVAVLSLALGIGANTALFSLMDVMLLRELPVRDPQNLVEFVRLHPDGAMMTNLPQTVYDYFRRDSSVLSEVLAVSWSNGVFRAAGPPRRVTAHQVSGSYFPSLAVPALIGRTLNADDDRPGAASHVAVISYAFWSRQFGRDPSAFGTSVLLDDEPFRVVGIMPPQFFGIDRAEVPDLWVPLAVDQRERQVWLLGRLRPGVTLARARAGLEPLFAQALESERGSMKNWAEHDRNAFLAQKLLINRATEGTSNLRWSYWEYSATLKILLGLTGMVLLVACANLANLLMARSAARSREIGIRLALGASRSRIARQLMTENLLLSVAGGLFGLLVAAWGHRVVVGFLVFDPVGVALDFHIDGRLLVFGLALSIVTGMVFGMVPAIRATRADPSASIRGGLRGSGGLHLPFAKALLALQIAISMVLLVRAGLFARSLTNLTGADLGFARENLLMIDIRPAAKAAASRQWFWEELDRRVSRLQGVRSGALGLDAVFGNGGFFQTIWIERPGQSAQSVNLPDNVVWPGFFATAGIPLLRGREFGEQDRENSPRVAIVNQTFARRFFAGQDPIGRHLGDRGAASSGQYEIVGVVGDAKYGAVREQVRPMVFYPMLQVEPAYGHAVLHVRTVSEASAAVESIRREIQALDDQTLITNVRTLPQVLHRQLRQDRMFASLAAFFALLAVALGAIGIYGVLAFRVAHRTPEIGVRMALGAQKNDVLWLVLRETLVLLAAGAAIGIPAALASARLVKSLLFGLQPLDPASLTAAVLVLLFAGAAASYIPARRAASVQPSAALRGE